MSVPFKELGGSPLEQYGLDGFTARREFLAALRCVVAEDNPGPPEQIEAECARLLDHLG